MRRALPFVALVLLALLLIALPALSGCGDPPRADIGFRYVDAQGVTHDGNLECRRAKDSPSCARLLADPDLLATTRDRGASAGQYFGPERLGITGVIDGRQVSDTFRRTDAAAEEDFQRVATILLPVLGMTPPDATSSMAPLP